MAVQPQNEAATTVERTEAPFPILADSEHVVAEAFGVYNLFTKNDSEAGASVFIINPDREILWVYLPEGGPTDRAPYQTILDNLSE